MIELTRTNDPVLISWLTCHLEAAGIGFVVFDTHTSILEGSIGAIPRRIMVLEDHEAEAKCILGEALAKEEPHPENSEDSWGWLADPVES